MAFNYLQAERLVGRVREMIDEVPYPSESVETEQDVLESPTTEIPDNFIYRSLTRAQNEIVGKCKASHCWRSIRSEEKDPANGDVSPGADSVRFLFSSVEREEVGDTTSHWALYRSAGRNEILKESLQDATIEDPAFTYDGARLRLWPALQNGDTVYYNHVVEPDPITGPSDVPGVDRRFEAALVWYAVAECWERKEKANRAQMARQRFRDEINPYRFRAVTTPTDGFEVTTE
jgi:hypothetical protein